MDRKYRQPGYMDSERHEKKKRPPKPKGPKEFRSRPMPGFHDVIRCAMCGSLLTLEIEADSQCPKCQQDLHSCRQCRFFDSSARFECTQPIPERIPKKNSRNQCQFFSPKKTVERQTSTAKTAPTDARAAFDALFKK